MTILGTDNLGLISRVARQEILASGMKLPVSQITELQYTMKNAQPNVDTLPAATVTPKPEQLQKSSFMQKIVNWIATKPKQALAVILVVGFGLGYGIGYLICKKSKRR